MAVSTIKEDIIAIEGLIVDCVVGVYPHERDTPQPLQLDVELILDTEPSAISETLRDSVDYFSIASQLVFLLQSGCFLMLETAAHALARYLLAPPALGETRAPISKASIRLTKLNALQGIGRPSLTIKRDASWVSLTHETKPMGTVDIIYETQKLGIYRLNIAPQKGIPLHIHQTMQESEMVLGDGLLCQNRPIEKGTVHRWPLGAAHRYDNPTDRYQTVLCVDSPPFIVSDEILVEGEPANVSPEPSWTQQAIVQ